MSQESEYAFWGEYEHSVDDYGRIIMPGEFRAGLGEEFVLTRGPDRSLYLFPVPVWEGIQRQLQDAVLDRAHGFLQRLFGGAAACRMDSQCRVTIPKHLREWAQISSNDRVTLIGQGRKIEIWAGRVWHEYAADAFTAARVYEAAETAGLRRSEDR